jgi:N-acetylneuraminate lyase
MISNEHLKGIFPALLTPLARDERVSAGAMERLLERIYAAEVDGVYVCGQTGEGLLLATEERRRAAEIAIRNSPRGKIVIIHVGAARTTRAIELARHAQHAGAHAISSLPPPGALSFEEVKSYYEAIAGAVDIPVLVYYFPEFSTSIKSLDQIFELCSIPNVVGLKFTDFDLYRMSWIARSGRVIFNGRDEVLAAGLLMGASGGIGSFYNVAPELFVDVWRHAQAGRYDRAREAQDRLNDLIRIVLSYPMIPALKTMLSWSGIDCGPAIAPRRQLSVEESRRLRLDLERASFDPCAFLASRPSKTA